MAAATHHFANLRLADWAAVPALTTAASGLTFASSLTVWASREVGIF